MLHLLGVMRVERTDPLGPVATSLLPNDGVGHAGELRVFRSGRCWLGRLAQDLRAGGRVGFARLLHASANKALEIFLAGHRRISFGCTTGLPPAADPR